MNASSTLWTAILRGLYAAILAGLSAGLVSYGQESDARKAILTGATAAVAVLVARGGIEGAYDAKRQSAGDVRSSDVHEGPPPPNAA